MSWMKLLCAIFFVSTVVLLFIRIEVKTGHEPYFKDELVMALEFEARPSRFRELVEDYPELLKTTRNNPNYKDMPVLAEWAMRAFLDSYFTNHVRIMINNGADAEAAIAWLLRENINEEALLLKEISEGCETNPSEI
jgi:hypothetical protein